jgi:hypothetical protein
VLVIESAHGERVIEALRGDRVIESAHGLRVMESPLGERLHGEAQAPHDSQNSNMALNSGLAGEMGL